MAVDSLWRFQVASGALDADRYHGGMNLGPTELIILLVIVLLLFGASRLPKLARSLGEASKEFKDGVKSGVSEAADVADKAKDTVKDLKD